MTSEEQMVDRIMLHDYEWQRVEQHLRTVGIPEGERSLIKCVFNVKPPRKWRCVPVDPALRAKVRKLADQGHSQREIARATGRSKGTVQYILQQHARS